MLGTLLMWTIIMDAGVTFIQRALRRENVLAAHRTHVYQRLVAGGYSHATISFMFMVLTFVAVRLTLAWSQGAVIAPVLIIIGLPAIWVILYRHTNDLQNTNTKNPSDL
jgi:hypothetical protein